MEQHKVSATALSKQLGYSTSIVQDWKKGKSRPTVAQIIALSQYFDVTTDYILLGKLPEESKNNILNAFNNNNHSTITINGDGSRQLTEIEAELIRITSLLDTRRKTQLLNSAYKLESERNENEDK